MGNHPINPPIVWSATFSFDRSDELVESARRASDRFVRGEDAPSLYTRWDNPTVRTVERAVAALENCDESLAFASGMAAISTTCLALLKPGATVVALRALYGGTIEFFETVLRTWGVRIVYVYPDTPITEVVRAERPQLVYIESPTNPTLRVYPLREVAEAAHAVGAVAVIDNTFATPVLQQPLMFGFDLVIHSATKALCGHHDAMGGFVVGSRHWLLPIWQMRKRLGGCMDPMAAYMIHRGIRTLPLRVMHQSATALEVARFLATHPRVERVDYPGLPEHPDHAIAAEQMRAFGTMISFAYRGTYEETMAMIDRLRVFRRAASLGGVDSLVTQPATTSHLHVDPEIRTRLGIGPNLVRLSIGLEPAEDLIADLEQAMA